MASEHLMQPTMSQSALAYEQTLMHGRYTASLAAAAQLVAEHHRRRSEHLIKLEELQLHLEKPAEPTYPWTKPLARTKRCLVAVREFVFSYVSEEWLVLILLGIVSAVISYAVEYFATKLKYAHILLFDKLLVHTGLRYLVWVLFPMVLIAFAVGFVQLVGPSAIGSGIPEVKTIMRGVVLHEYLTLRTLVAKVIGLTATLGSGMPLGRESPFVHIAAMVASLLSKVFTPKRSERRKTELLAAACAAGISCTFASPIGGVLYSIETTSMYFAVRDYWRSFVSSLCAAFTFRLLFVWFDQDEVTLTTLYPTHFDASFPFDLLELFVFAILGVVCGVAGAAFVRLHRKIVYLIRGQATLRAILQRNRFIYPMVVTLIVMSLTFPLGLGRFYAGKLNFHMAISELFSNFTWYPATIKGWGAAQSRYEYAMGIAEHQLQIDQQAILEHWNAPSIYLTLSLYFVMNFLCSAFAYTMAVPAGLFVPMFATGASIGRLFGEAMAAFFPNGIRFKNQMSTILPGGYAIVGAAAMSGAVTHTVSTAVIVFEVTGQIKHLLPCVVAVLVANAVAHRLELNIYDSMIRIKHLPYLPEIIPTDSQTYRTFVEDFMLRDIVFLELCSTYKDVRDWLLSNSFRSCPLIDNNHSRLLLGSLTRFELETLLDRQLDPARLQRKLARMKALRAESGDDSDGQRAGREAKRKSGSHSTHAGENGHHKTDDAHPADDAPAASRSKRFQISKVSPSDARSPSPARPDHGVTFGLDPVERRLSELDPVAPLLPSAHHAPLKSNLRHSADKGNAADEASAADDVEGAVHPRMLLRAGSQAIPYYPPYRAVSKVESDRNAGRRELQKIFGLNKHKTFEEIVISEDQMSKWEAKQLRKKVDFRRCRIDLAPFQLVERTNLLKVHTLFSLLSLRIAYVTSLGRLVGVVGLKELRVAIEGASKNQDAEMLPTETHADAVSDDEDSDATALHADAEHQLQTERRLEAAAEAEAFRQRTRST